MPLLDLHLLDQAREVRALKAEIWLENEVSAEPESRGWVLAGLEDAERSHHVRNHLARP